MLFSGYFVQAPHGIDKLQLLQKEHSLAIPGGDRRADDK